MLLWRFKLPVEYFQKCSAPDQKLLHGGDYGGSSVGLIFVDLHLPIALLPDHVQSLVKANALRHSYSSSEHVSAPGIVTRQKAQKTSCNLKSLSNFERL